MRKSTVIATCLVNSKMFRDLDSAEVAVRQTFVTSFPAEDFGAWNGNIPDKQAENIVKGVGRASTINIARFIERLADSPLSHGS